MESVRDGWRSHERNLVAQHARCDSARLDNKICSKLKAWLSCSPCELGCQSQGAYVSYW
jgi:hypothetical protein